MHYKTILVHVDDAPHASARFSAAAQLAHIFDAHLIGLASTGVDRFILDAVAADSASPGIAPYLDTLRQRASNALGVFGNVAQGVGVTGPERRQSDAEAYVALAAMASYCDLCVLGHYGQHARPDGQKRHMAADVAASSACPVLLIPDGVDPVLPFRRILLAWNGSREASRALHFAMPLLQGAVEVEVAILGDALEAGPDLLPALEIGQVLRRHGVAAKVVERRDTGDIGRALLEEAGNSGADLIVMGCYGHSRVRESLLGGATKSVLTSMGIPVFMSA